mmetsp:Transcript_397/g.545  ORF Transcript_397/g.545 Transcript_397/m.545 type:complete len:186 (+) Transcript_397:67-624(+)
MTTMTAKTTATTTAMKALLMVLLMTIGSVQSFQNSATPHATTNTQGPPLSFLVRVAGSSTTTKTTLFANGVSMQENIEKRRVAANSIPSFSGSAAGKSPALGRAPSAGGGDGNGNGSGKTTAVAPRAAAAIGRGRSMQDDVVMRRLPANYVPPPMKRLFQTRDDFPRKKLSASEDDDGSSGLPAV